MSHSAPRSLVSMMCAGVLASTALLVPVSSPSAFPSLAPLAQAQPASAAVAGSEQAAAPQLTVVKTETDIFDPRKVDIRAMLQVKGFPAHTPLKVMVDGVDAQWAEPHSREAQPTQNTDSAGYLEGHIKPARPVPHGSAHTITVSTLDGAVQQSVSDVDFAVGAIFNSSSLIGKETAIGGTGVLGIGNLPPGTRLVFFGVEGGPNWLNPLQQLWIINPTLPLLIFDVTIPRDPQLIGKQAVVGYQMPGRPVEYKPVISALGSDSPPTNNQHFSITQQEVPGGLYQTVYSKRSDSLYVSRSINGVGGSLYKLDPQTLEIRHERKLGKNELVFGLGVDEKNGTAWGTDSITNRLVVFNQDDLSTVKEFPQGSFNHPRDVVIDEQTGKAYISGTKARSIWATDQKSEAPISELGDPHIQGTMSLTLDPTSHELFTTSFKTPQMLSVNLNSGATTVYDLPADLSLVSSVAVDPTHRMAYIASQDNGDVTVYDLNKRSVVTRINTGAGALSAVYEPVQKFVYVANRGTGTVSVIDTATNTVIDNLPLGENVNHVSTDGKGNVYAVNKQSHYLRGEPRDSVFRISYDPTQTFERPVVKTYTPPFISPSVAGFVRGLITLLNLGGFGRLIPQGLMRFVTI